MARLGERLRKAQLLPSTEFMQVWPIGEKIPSTVYSICKHVHFLQVVYAVQGCASAPDSVVPDIQKLREKYTYNIYPCAQPLCSPVTPSTMEGSPGELLDGSKQCPLPSRGGSLFSTKKKSRSRNGESYNHKRGGSVTLESSVGMETDTEMSSLESFPVDVQIKKLHELYAHVARQPNTITCNLELVPPRARAICPQTKRTVTPLNFDKSPYAADVPQSVLQQSKIQSGFKALETFKQQRKNTFTISFARSASESSSEEHHYMVGSTTPTVDVTLQRFVRYEYSKISRRE